MTLKEWEMQHPSVMVRYHDNGGVQVFMARGDWELFHLSDYVVSSAVSGPSYWLVKRVGSCHV